MAEQLSVRRAAVALLLPVVIASCANLPRGGGDAAAMALELDGKVAGAPRSCIALDDARGAKVFDDAIVYRASRDRTYVNAAPGCRSFDPDPIFINQVFGSQLCRGDVVRLVSRLGGFPGPVCVLGNFTPYRKAKP